MPIIKRYPNRKLYDTEAKKYITLDGIAELIRQGEEVVVIDHTTNEDLTAVTLTQIIFEQEKKSSGFLTAIRPHRARACWWRYDEHPASQPDHTTRAT